MKHNTPKTADFADTRKKPRKVHKTRAQRKAEANALLPIHKRPIVCPPDRAGRSPLFRLGGMAARGLVIWLAAAGLIIFVSSALEFGVSNGVVFGTSLLVVMLGLLFAHSPLTRLIASLLSVGSAAGLVALNPRLPIDLLYGVFSLYNAALDRLYKVGYLTYVQFKAPINTPTPVETLMIIGVALLTLVITAVFVACLSGRVRIVPPAIIATTLLVVILTFNIYSNRIETNLGIALVMVSFAACLVMAGYDRLYRTRDNRRYDNELRLFEDSDRPEMPKAYTEKKAARTARRARKADMRRKRRTHTVTVEEELGDYFSTGKKKKKTADKAAKADKAQRKAEKQAARETARRIRAVKSYDRVTAESRAAMGGYASAAVLLTCLIAIALPALLIKGNFNTIDAIDEKMALARDYVTALLRGDDDRLDRLEYGADKDNFTPHSTELEHLHFTGKQIFYIQSRYNSTNYYLRGWIGTDYENGAWLAVDEETLDRYHELFGEDASPAEEMKYSFYHFMKPELVDDPAFTENLLSKFQSNTEYGFIGALVSLRRVNSYDTLTYFPTSYATHAGLMEFSSMTPKKLSFVNYFDGLYTGRRFNENGLSYATLTYAPAMKNDTWIENQATLQTAYILAKEVLLARPCVVMTADGATSYLTLLTNEQKDGTTMFMYTYKRGKEERIWRFYHNTDNITREGKDYIITTDSGTLRLTMDGPRVMDASMTTPTGVTNLVELYDRNMTDEERGALMQYIELEQSYGQYVFDTYMDRTDSAYIKQLAATIRDEAHTEAEEIVTEFYPDDPETPEDDSFTYDKTILVDVPADVTLAAVRNSTSADVYIQRDLLVRNVIDYIIDEMGCTYTIEPNLTNVDATLDGVENFLQNTKEGYCVQFASAVTLILRELGIPARYVEGYIGSDLQKISREDFVYGAYIRDYQAHAWVEVYYDGVGWIQYETTPQYYVGLYGTDSSVGTPPDKPVLPPEETKPSEEDTPAPDDDEETEDESLEETTDEEDANLAAITRSSLIGLGVLVIIGAIAALVGTIVSRARAAEDHRASIAAQVLEPGFGTNTSEEDRREMSLEMVDAVTNLLGFFDLSPQPGEFRDEYADRLTRELTAEEDKKKAKSRATEALPDLHTVLDGMAAEEFGHGMSVAEMKAVAALYDHLHRDIKKRIALPERMKLRYIKRKI